MNAAIETEKLTAGYRHSAVLTDVSLRVPGSTVFGLFGANGAGKSTLLRVIAGLMPWQRGSIAIFGERIIEGIPLHLRRRFGSLIEQPSLYLHLTGRENVCLAGSLKLATPSQLNAALQNLSLGEYLDLPVKFYSRGMRQWLGVIIAAMGDPDLLILDEPTNGLDSERQGSFRELIRDLNTRRGTTILMSSHQFSDMEAMVSHLAILGESGELLFSGSRNDLLSLIPQELYVCVDDPNKAHSVITKAGFSVQRSADCLLIANAGREAAYLVNQRLVEAGVRVGHLAVGATTLEELCTRVIERESHHGT